MSGKINHRFDYDDLEERNSNMEIHIYKCPHCTSNEGEFAEILLFIPKGEKIATQCTCNGQSERCCVVLDFMQSYNCEQYLAKTK